MSQVALQKPMYGLAQLLVVEGLLDEETAHDAVLRAKTTKTSFVHYIVENKILDAKTIVTLASKDFGVPLFDLSSFESELIPINLVSDTLILKHNVLPLYQRGNILFIAVSDPSSQNAFAEIKFHTGMETRSVLVEVDKLTLLIDKVLTAKDSQSLDNFLEDDEYSEIDIRNETNKEDDDEHKQSDDAPIVRFVHKMLLDAINKGASDIHFEPYEREYRVRFRHDGILYEVAAPPSKLGNRIAARLKVMSQLDISERRIPQDGRFKMQVSRKNSFDFRVSTCPVTNGEKIVIRLLDPSSADVPIEALGFQAHQETAFLNAINQPQGMILVTGPTGSGKTVTMYTALKLLNSPEKNISTAEDPVEIKVAGINQVQINNKTGLNFSTALRSFLRQDPDIIMVGEMRDLETAEIGVKAAQTGHLVLSTLHTNSAPETLSRLLAMGIPAFNIASSVNLIIAQRLARRLCKDCKEPINIPKDELISQGFDPSIDLDQVTIYRPVGCTHCTKGYKGRVGLYEVLEFSKTIGDAIMTGASSLDIDKMARSEGMCSIRESGLQKVCEGITSLEEVNRVTKD